MWRASAIPRASYVPSSYGGPSYGSPYAQGGYAMFGVTRASQDQPAIDAMAGNYFTKRQLSTLATALQKDIRSLTFDADEAAQIHMTPFWQTIKGTELKAPTDTNFTAAIRFYEYAMNVDYVMAWMRQLSQQIDSMASNATPQSVAYMARYIIRPDFGEWDYAPPLDDPAVHAGSGAITRQITTPDINYESGLASLEADTRRPAGWYRHKDVTYATDLCAHDLVLDIVALSMGFCRPTIFQLDGKHTGAARPMRVAAVDARELGTVQTAFDKGLKTDIGTARASARWCGSY